MATTHVAPASFGQNQADLGQSYVFTEEQIREELTEKLNVLQMGLVGGVGEFTGSGSDTVRITRYGALGFAERFEAMAGEDDPIPLSGFTTDFDTVTVARYGLSKSETWQAQILGRVGTPGHDLFVMKMVESWLATLRHRMCVAGATFTGSVGTTATAWSYDDEIELIQAFNETEGIDLMTDSIYSVRHPEQLSDLANSLRNEPGFQTPEAQAAIQGLNRNQAGASEFLGLMNFRSHDVQQSGGDHVGFAYVGGAIVWGAPSTGAIRTREGDLISNVEDFGLIITGETKGNVATGRIDANAWFGVDTVDPSLRPSFKCISVND